MKTNLNEVYRNSGLGKWFHGESATKEPGWDRYNSKGERVGKCGDAKEGSSYSACLSRQKAERLGKEGISNFVNRKRSAQSKRGRGKKGIGKKGKKPIFVKTGASNKMNENINYNNNQFFSISEGCGCEKTKQKQKMIEKIKNKYMKETTNKWSPLNKDIIIEKYKNFINLNLNELIGKKVLVDIASKTYTGEFRLLKENCALVKDGNIIKTFDIYEINKLVYDNKKIIITEGKNKPNDPEKWSSCKSQAKKKFDVYPSAYANAWAAKCYKKKGGSWSKVNEEYDPNKEIAEPLKIPILAEAQDLLLKEKIKHLFFKEDIVNTDNIGKLTPQNSNSRAKNRDEIREKVKNRAKVVTGPKDKNGNKLRDDTPKEASYRLATYIELNKKEGQKEKKKKGSKSSKKSKK